MTHAGQFTLSEDKSHKDTLVKFDAQLYSWKSGAERPPSRLDLSRNTLHMHACLPPQIKSEISYCKVLKNEQVIKIGRH